MLKVRILTGVLMGTFMSFFMSAFITAVNTGLDDGYLMRWMIAFPWAWFGAVPLAVLAGPHAQKLAKRLAGAA